MTADKLIEIRKGEWEKRHSIEFDRRLVNAIARQIREDKELRNDVQKYPEKLIELVFIVVDKNQVTKPFFLNEVQHEFIDILNKTIKEYEEGLRTEISLLVLKGRQQGFTTLITAYQLARCITHKNFQGFTLADVSDNAESIFEGKAKFPYSMLPESLKPTEKFNNKRQFLFSKLNSSWAVDTATKNVGRSRTINFFHGSECAFWKDGIALIQAALGEALTKNCIKIYESTANGYNDYEAMWNSGVHVNCFFAWWKTKEYSIDFPSEESKIEFLEQEYKREGWIYNRLRWLKTIGLTTEQRYWYLKKYEGYIDKRLIRQEYPCGPEEAFLLSGDPVFDSEAIVHRLRELKPAIKTGRFIYDYDGTNITNIKWRYDPNGFIKIYQVPDSPAITKYCIGGDTAGDGSDYFTAHVLDARTGTQVAVLKHKFDSDQYTRQMYCLGKLYKNALIGIESNFDSYPIKELERLGYRNMYVREDTDNYTHKLLKKFGFRTTSITRPMIISRLIEIVREHTHLINDEDTLRELMTIIRNEKGKVEAPAGGHDDMMMGLAIAYEIRNQVKFDKTVIHQDLSRQFNFEKNQTQKDYGEPITVI